MEVLRKTLNEKLVLLDIEATKMASIIDEVLDLLSSRGLLRDDQRREVRRALVAREEKHSSAIGRAVALPHAYLDALSEPHVVFARLKRPTNLGAPDGIPTRFVFLLIGPREATSQHLETLTTIARLTSDDAFRYEAWQAKTHRELLDALEGFDARTTKRLAEPGQEVSEGLESHRTPFAGLMADLRRRLPHYRSDFRDGLHPKCVASTLFLFFACLAPAVTFGGMMEIGTNGHIGAVEMLVASALCGVVYALVGGHPLIILGGTGPLLIFTVILYGLCEDLGIPFLPTYACVGVWTGFFVIVLSITNSSALMRFFSRFTHEIFAALIALIFIVEAIQSITRVFVGAYSNDNHDKAFLSLIVAVGTYGIALNLARLRRSRYLLPRIREFLADFGPAIALGVTTLVAVWYGGEVNLDVLTVPEELGPTLEGRAWLVNPFDESLPRIIWLVAPVPAFFAAILLYLDQNITARIINSRDHHLEKGAAYHLDLSVVGALVAVCSLFGLPWLVAATVRSLNHLRSLATTEEVISKDGDSRERIIHVRETRLTGLAIHLAIGLSLLALPLLRLVPMATLYGLFLYMGIVSIKGNQFFERLNLWLMDPALYPPSHYIRRVPRSSMHRFTLLQAVCLAILWGVKTGPPIVAILFPVVIALLVPVRLFARRLFPPDHLVVLDSDGEPE